MKIIYLDIDSVLNSDVYTESEMYKQATVGMSDAKIMLVAHHLHLDPDALKLVNDLVDRSGAEVVLSSTWRIKYSPAEVTKMMQDRGATFTIKASTPSSTRMSQSFSRGKEIQMHLDKLKDSGITPEYVILDDRHDMDDLKDHLVQTEMKYGLTKEHVERALEILKVEK